MYEMRINGSNFGPLTKTEVRAEVERVAKGRDWYWLADPSGAAVAVACDNGETLAEAWLL